MVYPIKIFCLISMFLALVVGLPAGAQQETSGSSSPLPEDRMQSLRLQIFLDDAECNPGKLDGYWGTFTAKALKTWLKAQGREDEIPENWPDEGPKKATQPADLSRVEPLLTTYQVREEDRKMVGPAPQEPEEIAEQNFLPYDSLWELVAEKFHSDPELIAELNPDMNRGEVQPGDTLTVPNIGRPFDLQELNAQLAKKLSEEKADGKSKKSASPNNAAPPDERLQNVDDVPEKEVLDDPRIVVDKTDRTLTLYDGDTIVVHAPITPGASSNPAPTGDWKMLGIAWMPTFRYDEDMLERGETSEDYKIFPQGPNSPVGVIWMALNSEGIGLHGTKAPDTIGRAGSHGCIRMSNWDAWEVGRRAKAGMPVRIEP